MLITRSHPVAVGAPAVAGILAIVATAGLPETAPSIPLPQIALASIDLDLRASIALGIPLLILTVGVGNIQSLAVVRSEGYRPEGNLFGLEAGVAAVINALGGGHPGAIGSSGAVIAASPSAGPQESRFWAVVPSSLPVAAIALAANSVIDFVQQLPLSYTLMVGVLALGSPCQRVLRKTWCGSMRSGAVTAFVVAALPFQFAGMPMAFWAIATGLAVTTVLEHGHFVQRWQSNAAHG